MGYTVRRARTSDVPAIKRLLDADAGAGPGKLLSKETVILYESVQEFWVAEDASGGDVSGCGALHVMWEDVAEIRTLVVDKSYRGQGIGHRIVGSLLSVARELGVSRVFVLTFETAFFARHGFEEIRGAAVSPRVYTELLRSYDEGVAEFLELDRVKPNTLGNTRMLLRL
jgi:amino-acid N-acetyltransferase